jgi:hypothetical protein
MLLDGTIRRNDMIDYSKILQPQEDGYDVEVFNKIKYSKGYTKDHVFPSSFLKFDDKVIVLPTNESSHTSIKLYDFNHDQDYYRRGYNVGYTCLTDLLDIFVPVFTPDNNISGQMDGESCGYPNSWVIRCTMSDNPAVTFTNLMHELMHWKLVALGFGTGANTFFPTTQEFILNDSDELCWSIVNSYDNTAQAAVGNKATNRPVSASIHAYLSFLSVAYSYVQFLKIDPENAEARFKSRQWGERFDKSLNEIWKVGRFTDSGYRLMYGITNWTADFFRQYEMVRR